jgi:hypothetical protein
MGDYYISPSMMGHYYFYLSLMRDNYVSPSLMGGLLFLSFTDERDIIVPHKLLRDIIIPHQ